MTKKILQKAPTGIKGLDELTGGGFPKGKTTLIFGGPGCGKTIMAMDFLVKGALDYDEPGLFVSFEEPAEQLKDNFASFGYDLDELEAQNKLHICNIALPTEEIVASGGFSLDPLMIRLERLIRKVGAARIALDTLDHLFAGFPNDKTLRNEITRMLVWLREKGVTTVFTGEMESAVKPKFGFEMYVADCLVFLDHRINSQVAKRRMRVVKYRGSEHSADEVPFLIGSNGLQMFPITSLRMTSKVGDERVSSGIADLDMMLEGKGYFKGSSILVTGKAGTGKSSLAASFVEEAGRKEMRSVYFSFEESPGQLTRNMASIGINLEAPVQEGLLTIASARPTHFGLEEHLINAFQTIDKLQPECVVIDPVSNFTSIGTSEEVKAMLTRLLDGIKMRGITALMTSLSQGTDHPTETESRVSSLMDTWIVLDQKLVENVRHRELFIYKSRGMEHSVETKELIMSPHGLTLRKLPYLFSEYSHSVGALEAKNGSR